MMEGVKVITTQLPTYLEKLSQEDRNTKLVFIEKATHQPQLPKNDNILEVSENTTELDLTGTPLQTDLGTDETLDIDEIISRPPSWTIEEGHQFPLSLKSARKFINNQLNDKKPTVSIYCVCNGDDPQHTVGLGITMIPHKISRTLVYVLPCCYKNQDVTTVEYMKKDHIKNFRRNAQIKISTKEIYDVYGYNMKNCHSLQSAEFNGNISIEVSTVDANNISQSNTNVKMNFQVIVGHKDSSLLSFFGELSLIQSYIKLLESVKQLEGSTVVNKDNSIHCEEIFPIIRDFVNTASSFKKLTRGTLDLKNLRPLYVLDKLWNVLKQCETLNDLRDCFQFFFEEIADTQTKIQLPAEDKSSVAEIVNGILRGRIAVPTLSFLQSLELLIDIGLEKVKNDYIVIITNFSTITNEKICKKWSEFSSNISNLDSNNAAHRRTRVTINPKTVITDLTSHKLKLTYLDSMQKVVEFMFLYEENMPKLEESFHSYCETLCDKFLVKFPNLIQTCDIRQSRLCHFSVNISSADAQFLIKDGSPVAFSVTLFSTIQFAEVQTVFHFSECPILPPCIFEDYDIPGENNEDNILYVTKLVKYIENC